MSAPHKVTTDFTLTPLPSNGHWLCRAVILCAVRKFGFFQLTIKVLKVANDLIFTVKVAQNFQIVDYWDAHEIVIIF